MNIAFDIPVEIKAKASSSYTTDTIRRRLKALRKRKDQAAKDEIVYLNELLARD
jgi:hypothetical protein